MEKYGTIFDTTFNLKKDKLRHLISVYFDYPTLKKFKNTENTSIYSAYNQNQLIAKKQFIIATCKLDNNLVGTSKHLKDLSWISFQTRMLDLELLNHIAFTYLPKRNNKYMSPLSIHKREKLISAYLCPEYDCIVSLLHDNENVYEYPDHGTLNQALESFKTIITFL